MKRFAFAIAALALEAYAQIEAPCLTECCQSLSNRPAQNYTFYQSTGHFIGGTGEWHIDTFGYSGKGKGRNNPAYQCADDGGDIGPLPASIY